MNRKHFFYSMSCLFLAVIFESCVSEDSIKTNVDTYEVTFYLDDISKNLNSLEKANFTGEVKLFNSAKEITLKLDSSNVVSAKGLKYGTTLLKFNLIGYSSVSLQVNVKKDSETTKSNSFSLKIPLMKNKVARLSGVANAQLDISDPSGIKESLPSLLGFMSLELVLNDSSFYNKYFRNSNNSSFSVETIDYENTNIVVSLDSIVDNQKKSGFYSVDLPTSTSGLDYYIKFYDLNIIQKVNSTTEEKKLFSPYNADFRLNEKPIIYNGKYKINIKAYEYKELNIFFGEGV